MFGNFIFFIVALLIYSTYQPPETPQLAVWSSLLLFLGLTCGYALITRWNFRKIEKLKPTTPLPRLDHRFSSVLTQSSILALVFFGIDIYALNLPAFTSALPLMRSLPTLEGLLFMAIFIGHLIILWCLAYQTHHRVLSKEMSRREFVNSHLVFNLPVLLPWLLLSGIFDLIHLLPLPGLQQMLDTRNGQIAFFLFFLFFVALTAPALIQRFWGCRPLEPGVQRDRIEALCLKSGLKYADIVYWPIFGGRMITAGVMGLVSRFRYLLVTRALLNYLTPDELEAVIAHEIGHVKRRHLLYYLLFFGGFMLVSLLGLNLVFYTQLHSDAMYRFIAFIGRDQVNATSLIYSVSLIILIIIYFRFIFGYFMRNFERQADTYVYAVFPTARPLIRTLEKIALSSGQDPQRPNWHHFSIAQRIGFLERCEANREWVVHHDRKIRRSIILFFLGLLMAAGLNYHIDYVNTDPEMSREHLERIITREIASKPEDANLRRFLGDISYEMGKWEDAMAAYEATIALAPQNVHALNNLAWLYATCEDQQQRQPRRALSLARRAVKQMEAPHILDTLAEAYFVNGHWQEALAAARNALALARDNRDYYQGQVDRFETYAALHQPNE